ncbi:PLDc N-terminal domain-containing protein [Pontibacter liquoris]|uniref:PLDc N-terminal domain-containing protein n=1 Tax=Pontibacter liquoris TaxID=2905677 RepID=UPI001FA77946|nr:PLDc N-terminal domain-containing protein [Pontibacter liquoris]
MNLLNHNPVVFWLIILNYVFVVYSLHHLVFKSHYNLNQRLTWMAVLWIVPIVGPAIYWFAWNRRSI